MRRLIFTLVIPLTIISFAFFTKWWYALPEDAPDTMFIGFPFPYVGDGWGSSMSLQYFAIEFIADLLTYFAFWFLLAALIDRFLIKIKLNKALTIILWCFSGLIISGAVFIASVFESNFYLTRDFKMEVLDSGFNLPLEHKQRPDLNKYHSENKSR